MVLCWLSPKLPGLCLQLPLPGPELREVPTRLKNTDGVAASCGCLSDLLHLLSTLITSISLVPRTSTQALLLTLGCAV